MPNLIIHNNIKERENRPDEVSAEKNKSVVAAVRMTNVCLSHLVLLNKRLKSLLVVGQAAVETQTLLGLRQPLQQDVDGGVELLRLQARGGTDHQSASLRRLAMIG